MTNNVVGYPSMLVAQRVVKVGRLFLFETRDGGVGPNHNDVSGLDESLLIMYCSMYCPPSASPGSQGSHFQHGQCLREIFHSMSTMFYVSIPFVWQSHQPFLGWPCRCFLVPKNILSFQKQVPNSIAAFNADPNEMFI